MTKIAFVNLLTIPLQDIQSQCTSRHQVIGLPLGILYLSAVLKQARCVSEVGLIDYVEGFSKSGVVDDLNQFIIKIAQESINSCFSLVLYLEVF